VHIINQQGCRIKLCEFSPLSLLIEEVSAADVPMELLLLADPSEDKVRSYLSGSKRFIASRDGVVVGACVVRPRGTGAYELMNIAVHPVHQQSGYGTVLLRWVIDFLHHSGASQIEVGTGTFGYQLAFYQRHGFRVTSIDHDFFVNNYPEPIFEDGIQLLDMLRLTLKYSVSSS
jgi:ribosomal protein S18 acetylase RimI-like enzyme